MEIHADDEDTNNPVFHLPLGLFDEDEAAPALAPALLSEEEAFAEAQRQSLADAAPIAPEDAHVMPFDDQPPPSYEHFHNHPAVVSYEKKKHSHKGGKKTKTRKTKTHRKRNRKTKNRKTKTRRKKNRKSRK